MNKIVIIGCGNVGMSYAYALLNQKTSVNEIALIDLDTKRVEGEVMDLNHGIPFGPNKINVKVGDYSDCQDANIVCICAGSNQAPGETRLDLLQKNKKIFEIIINQVTKNNFKGIFLIATNPVDIMTYLTFKISNFSSSKVIGSGTTLDTARLRYLISEDLNINSKNVHAYVLGEHGDSEFVAWSNGYIGNNPINNYVDDTQKSNLEEKVKTAAYEIINRKGATYYAIGMSLVRITNAILNDENSILTVSSYNNDYNIFIGMPSIINKNGIEEIMELNLSKDEEELFRKSANIIKNEIDKI